MNLPIDSAKEAVPTPGGKPVWAVNPAGCASGTGAGWVSGVVVGVSADAGVGTGVGLVTAANAGVATKKPLTTKTAVVNNIKLLLNVRLILFYLLPSYQTYFLAKIATK